VEEVIVAGPLVIHVGQGLVEVGGRVVPLSVREFAVLVALAGTPGVIVRREDLYARVWGRALRDGDRSIDVYVHKLRTKLEEAAPDHRFIHTHVGFGYRFQSLLSHPVHIHLTSR
jgi:DNA-binding response OmpR family regulator